MQFQIQVDEPGIMALPISRDRSMMMKLIDSTERRADYAFVTAQYISLSSLPPRTQGTNCHAGVISQ